MIGITANSLDVTSHGLVFGDLRSYCRIRISNRALPKLGITVAVGEGDRAEKK
jgi:hypothetical protein